MYPSRINIDHNEKQDECPPIIPQSKDIEFKSDVTKEPRVARQSSNVFGRLMSMDSQKAMSTRNLLMHNAVYRKRVCSIAVNVIARILTVCMNVVLLVLSIAYCVAQLSTVHLKLLKECTPKTKEEIYHHSYLAGLQEDGTVAINEESQWGHTDDACYTTKSFQMDTDQLWYSNVYEHVWQGAFDIKAMLFGMLAVYSLLTLLYNWRTITSDLRHLKSNTLHTLSNRGDATARNSAKSSGWKSKIVEFRNRIEQILEDEGTLWIIRCFILEIIEFGAATLSMMLYNGYWWNDPENEDDVYLAQKPQYITLFASVIAFNMFGSAFLWLSYSWAPGKCYGLTFRVMLFFIDDLSDLFYTIFPLLVIYHDDYNAETADLSVLLGQLYLENRLEFISVFGFLFALCTKSLHLSHSASTSMHNRYYEEFELDDAQVSWIDVDERTKRAKQKILSIMSCLYVGAAILILVRVTEHMQQADTYCNSVKESIFFVNGTFSVEIDLSAEQQVALEKSPELYLWDYCLYQTYPFTANDLHQCQCRIFVLDLEDLKASSTEWIQLNLDQNKLLSGLLKHSWMLEKLSCTGIVASTAEDPFVFEESMMHASHLKAFEWNGLGIVDLDKHISQWDMLEYIKLFPPTYPAQTIRFDGLVSLSELQYFNAHIGRLTVDVEGLEAICSLKHLLVLRLRAISSFGTIPHCFAELQELRMFVARDWSLTNVPISIFGLPRLEIFSLFRAGGFTFDSFVAYNLPENVNRADVNAVNKWFDENLYLNENTEYYLQLSAMCDTSSMEWETLPSKLNALLEETCEYSCSGDSVSDRACMPWNLGDGHCDAACNSAACNYDEGDCLMLCFAEELTECNWFKLLNDECDKDCDNKYCSGHGLDALFTDQIHTKERNGVVFGADFYQCPVDSQELSYEGCAESANFNQHLDVSEVNGTRIECKSRWIGDSICDSACRSVECSNDNADCEQGCVGFCSFVLIAWQLGNPPASSKIEHTTYCTSTWPTLVSMRNDATLNNLDCEETVKAVDFNQDDSLNFREMTPLIYQILYEFDFVKAWQIDCSTCVGLENYNV